MKNNIKASILLLAGAFMALASSLSGVAQDTENQVTFVSDQNASSVKVSGSSSLHDWSVDSQTIKGEVVFQGDVPDALAANNNLSFQLKKAGVTIPVKSLSGDKDGLNEKMYNAMKAEKHPRITYKLEKASFDARPAPNKVRLQTQGKLTVSGKTRSLDMPMEVTRKGSGRLVAQGETDLKMTDFGIEPPTAMGGLVTAYDKVTVTWKWPVIREVTPRYEAGSIMTETVSVFVNRYDSARSSLSEGQVDKAKRSLKQLARGADRIKLSLTDLNEDQQSEAQPLIDQFRGALDKALNAGDLDALRERFKKVSGTLKDVVAAFGHDRDEPVLYLQCAKDGDSNRRWLGKTGDATCPYLPEDQRSEPDGFAIGRLSGSSSK